MLEYALLEYPWLSLLPPLVAIVLCFITKRVLPSLFVGVFIGVLILKNFNPFSALAQTALIYVQSLAGVELIADGTYAVDLFKPTIILFDFVIGGLVGLIYLSGGAQGLANVLVSKVKTRRGGEIVTAIMGMIVFFDDYSNTVIVGNGLRATSERLKISKEKFSYILDSTAAPIATIALISTWIGYQVGVIGDALPPQMEGEAYTIFLRAIPYSFYSIFAIFIVLFSTTLSMDFGPMKHAEERAMKTGKLMRDGAVPLGGGIDLETLEGIPQKAMNMLIPLITLVSVSLFSMWWTGGAFQAASFMEAISNSDSMLSLLWGSLVASIIAIFMYKLEGIASLSKMMDAFINGARLMILPNLILISAWSMGSICGWVGLADYVVASTKDVLEPWFLPAMIFLISAFISFSTGTAWGTMAIVIPITIPLAIQLGVPIHIAIAPVLTGGVFGDHCSPISDTTVMSSTFAGSDHIDHVRTQLPYSLLAGTVALLMFLFISIDFEYRILSPLALVLGGVLIFVIFSTLSRYLK